MGKIRGVISFAILFFCITTTGMTKENLIISSGDWPPYVSNDLKHQGVATHIMAEIFDAAGYTLKMSFYPFARAYEVAKAGTVDGTAVWLKKPDREVDFYYSEPVVEEQHVFFYLKNNPFDWKSIQDLKGKNIGGMIKFSYGSEFDAAAEAGVFSLARTSSDEQNFNKLLLNRIQIYPQEINVGYYELQKHFKPEQIQLITHHPKLLMSDQSYLLLSKKIERNKQLMEKFNEGLKKLKESGKYDQFFVAARRGDYIK